MGPGAGTVARRRRRPVRRDRRTLDFLGTHLELPAAARKEAIRIWVDGVRVLREIAQWLGLAQSDGWCLTGESAAEDQLSWYDEVIGQLDEAR